MPALHRPAPQRALREFCAAIYGAQCLVASAEQGPRVAALMRYAATLLDAIDVDLLEAGLSPGDPAFASVHALREHYERLVLALLTASLRRRGRRAVTMAHRP